MTATPTADSPLPLKRNPAPLGGHPGKRNKPPRRPRVEEDRPVLAEAALMTYAATGSKNATMRQTGLCRDSVTAILERNRDAIPEARKRLAERALCLSDQALGRVSATMDKLSGLPAIIGAKTLGQMALEQLDKSPAAVVVNVQMLNQTMLDTDALAREVRAMEDRLSGGATLPVASGPPNNE